MKPSSFPALQRLSLPHSAPPPPFPLPTIHPRLSSWGLCWCGNSSTLLQLLEVCNKSLSKPTAGKHVLTYAHCVWQPDKHDREVCAAGANTTDASQLGTTRVPDGPWVEELPIAWRSHMNAQLNAVGAKHSFRQQGGARAGLWAAAPASKTVPLDQGSISGILQHVSSESVRRQVGQVALCFDHIVL